MTKECKNQLFTETEKLRVIKQTLEGLMVNLAFCKEDEEYNNRLGEADLLIVKALSGKKHVDNKKQSSVDLIDDGMYRVEVALTKINEAITTLQQSIPPLGQEDVQPI
jgi:hypothetical protein